MRGFLVLTALVAGLVVPLAAQASPTEVGPRIALFGAPASFPAETPFHVTQGFTCELGKAACLSGFTHFDLSVDGQPMSSATDLVFGDDGTLLAKLDLTNFRDGLPAGTHTLSAQWYYLGALEQTQTVVIDFA